METNDETNIANEHNMVKNPNWQEADQLTIFKRRRGAELGSTKKQLQLHVSGQSGTRTRDKVMRPNHSATLPPVENETYYNWNFQWSGGRS